MAGSVAGRQAALAVRLGSTAAHELCRRSSGGLQQLCGPAAVLSSPPRTHSCSNDATPPPAPHPAGGLLRGAHREGGAARRGGGQPEGGGRGAAGQAEVRPRAGRELVLSRRGPSGVVRRSVRVARPAACWRCGSGCQALSSGRLACLACSHPSVASPARMPVCPPPHLHPPSAATSSRATCPPASRCAPATGRT